jgi:hypothetical protein
MISAATRWLIDRTTMVAVVASLARGSQKETIVPTTARCVMPYSVEGVEA